MITVAWQAVGILRNVPLMFYFVMYFMCASWREDMPHSLQKCTLIMELHICTRYVKLTL